MDEEEQKGTGWGGYRPNTGAPKTRWKEVFSDDVKTALSLMGLEDAVRAKVRQDDAEIGLVEQLILAEKERRLQPVRPRRKTR